jgi:hypothetical protein
MKPFHGLCKCTSWTCFFDYMMWRCLLPLLSCFPFSWNMWYVDCDAAQYIKNWESQKEHIFHCEQPTRLLVCSLSFFIITNLACGMCFETSNTKNLFWFMGNHFGLSRWYLIPRYLVEHELDMCLCWCDIAPLFCTPICDILCYHF